jgi:hypothetical protein
VPRRRAPTLTAHGRLPSQRCGWASTSCSPSPSSRSTFSQPAARPICLQTSSHVIILVTIALGGGLHTCGWGSAVARSCGQDLDVAGAAFRGRLGLQGSVHRPSASAGRAGFTSPAPRAPAFATLLPFTLCTMLAPVQHQRRSKKNCHHAASPSFARCCVRFTVFCPLVFADMCTHRPSSLLQAAAAHACVPCSLTLPASRLLFEREF